MKKLILATILAITSVGVASAQQEVVLESVTNSAFNNFLLAGKTHVFSIRYTNFPPGACSTAFFNINNGFVLSSPDGASWNHTLAVATDAFMGLPWNFFFVNHYNEDPTIKVDQGNGVSPNYFNVHGVGLVGIFPPDFDDVALDFEIATNLADTNLHICIDKTELGNLGSWNWAGIPRPECNVAPDWAGPHCFTITTRCCFTRRGNIDMDPAGLVDIADLTFLIDHLFINFPSLVCPEQGDLDNDPAGKVDIADLTILLDHLFINFPQLVLCGS